MQLVTSSETACHRFNVLPSGEGKAEFNYKLADCNFKRLVMEHLIYKNELTFRPDQGRVLQLMCIPSSVYPRCLLDSVKGNSRFLPRYHSSAIILYLQSFKWELLDDPMQSSIVTAVLGPATPLKRGDEWESNGFRHTSVLGPLIIMDPSQQNAHNASEFPLLTKLMILFKTCHKTNVAKHFLNRKSSLRLGRLNRGPSGGRHPYAD
ncbi:hypothetical protein F7725_011815 [Dissostichus mawsoni]|uniref:Uncharacterized protein n=1 Tax=Dissostichus mawsoni TaxID=36200 RepID=A0A7J5Z9X0_DISMA|nr:hypothetical protein F7725_011815 [Dissostichus mawsoni]